MRISPFFCFCMALLGAWMPSQTQAQRSYYRIGKTTVSRILILDEGGHLPFYRIAVRHADSVLYLGPEVVDEYRSYKEEIFRSYTLPDGEVVFMEVVEEGPLTLLYLIDRDRQKRFFLELGGGAILELASSEEQELYFREVIAAAWSKCEQLKPLVEDAVFQRASLRNLIRTHNTCLYLPPPERQLHLAVQGLNQGLGIGMGDRVAPRTPLAAFYAFDFGRTWSWGLLASLEQPIRASQWHWTVGLHLRRYQARDNIVFSLRAFADRTFQARLSLLDLGFPIGIRYIHPGLRLRPGGSLTLTPSYWVVNQVEVAENLIDSVGLPVNRRTYREPLGPLGLGIQLSTSLDYQLTEKQALRLETGYAIRMGVGPRRFFNQGTWLLGLGLLL